MCEIYWVSSLEKWTILNGIVLEIQREPGIIGGIMSDTLLHGVNCGFAWLIVALAIGGYFLTCRKIGERWMFCVVLSCGWGLFAVAQTIVLLGTIQNPTLLGALWISSFVLVICSLVLIFLKLTSRKITAGQ